MTYLLKDPEAVLDYAVDWGAEYLSGDAVSQSGWDVVPAEAGGVAIVESSFDDRVSKVTASGGVPGRLYQLTNRVVLESGRVDSRSIVLRVEKR